jgi:hypothetical protein
VPVRLCAVLRNELSLTSAVETGTFGGEGAVALRGIFGTVWSIELSKTLHEAAKVKHATEGLEFIYGASQTVLPELLRGIGEPALFWLDGHWCGGDTAGEDRECPILREIAAIDAWPYAGDSVLLIDDARLFLGPPEPPLKPEEWPTFLQVLDALRSRFDRYVTVLEDVIIAGPSLARPAIEQYWLERLTTAPTSLAPETSVRDTDALLRDAADRLRDAEAEIRALHCSTSWRATAPFRMVTRVFRR